MADDLDQRDRTEKIRKLADELPTYYTRGEYGYTISPAKLQKLCERVRAVKNGESTPDDQRTTINIKPGGGPR